LISCFYESGLGTVDQPIGVWCCAILAQIKESYLISKCLFCRVCFKIDVFQRCLPCAEASAKLALPDNNDNFLPIKPMLA
jgi:hypothetical protein